MLSVERVEPAFERVLELRFFRERRGRMLSPDYWRALNPGLTITTCGSR